MRNYFQKTKQTWIGIKMLINKQSKKPGLPEAIKVNNILTNNKTKIADSFNK
jgi:hypothetical protein